MKKLSWMIFASLALLLAACDKNETTEQSDDLLIVDIATSAERVMVEPAELPRAILAFVDDVYFDTYIEMAYRVRERGYELNMGSGENLFFDRNGTPIRFRGPDDGRFGPDGPHGRCNYSNFGVVIAIDRLPEPIRDYLNENYPDHEIARAKRRSGHIVVMLRGPILLLFDSNGNFVDELTPIHNCYQPCRNLANTGDLPIAIGNYIDANYPDAQVRQACLRNGVIVVFMIGENGRIILGFDIQGNFLFERS
jgi:hypothetical protein